MRREILCLTGIFLAGAAFAQTTEPAADPGALTGGFPSGVVTTSPIDDSTGQNGVLPDLQVDLQLLVGSGAVLRALDTLKGTLQDFEVRVGETVRYERFEVKLEACRYPEDELESEAYAFLSIVDSRAVAKQFSGWMLASSPALSAFDHARYDIWVIKCKID